MHACARAEKLCLGVVTDLLVSFGILRERTGIDQAGIIQALDVGEPFLPLRFVGNRIDLAVIENQIGTIVRVDEAIHQVRERAHTVVFDGAAQRHFVGLAIAVGILALEGFQHCLELFGGRRHFNA